MGCLSVVITPIRPSIGLGVGSEASVTEVTSVRPQVSLSTDCDGGVNPVVSLMGDNLSSTICAQDMMTAAASLVNGLTISCKPICRLSLVSFSYDFNLDFMS